MPFDAIPPIASAADLLPVGSTLDAALMHRPQQKVLVLLSNLHFVGLIESGGRRLLEESGVSELAATKVQQAELFSRENELVQDRDVGDSWYQFCPAIPGRE